jgi:hypothetical protein
LGLGFLKCFSIPQQWSQISSNATAIDSGSVATAIDEDPTGKKLLPTGIPAEYSERGSPDAENFLFGNAGLSMHDLNNKGIVAFTVVWPKRH